LSKTEKVLRQVTANAPGRSKEKSLWQLIKPTSTYIELSTVAAMTLLKYKAVQYFMD
jgi:hypothetical protein